MFKSRLLELFFMIHTQLNYRKTQRNITTYGDWPCSSFPPFPGVKRNDDDNDQKRHTAREIVSVRQQLTNMTDKLNRDLKDYVYNCPCCGKSLMNIDKYIEEHNKRNGPGHGHGNGANPPTRTDLR